MKRALRTAAVCIAFGIITASLYTKSVPPHSTDREQENSVTLRWFIALSDYEKTFNPSKNVSDAKILERTGVRLEIETGDTAVLDALIATDQLPDLVTVEADAKERIFLENSGMAASLEPLFAEYAPQNQIPDSMKEWYRNSDGNWYSIASYYYGPERTNYSYGGNLGTHNNNYVREDLLTQTGIPKEELTTKEGMLKALRAAYGLTYGGEKVIPYSGWDTKYIAGQFGMAVESEDGRLLSPYRQPEWLEALLFGNQLYCEGLMPQEEFTESVNQRRNQIATGRIFCCTGYNNVKDAKERLKSKDPAASIEYAGQIRGNLGSPPNLRSVSSGGWTVTLVNRESKNMDKIIHFIDYMTTDEGILDAAPEIGADTYVIINGKYMQKDSVLDEFAQDYDQAAAKYYMNLEFFVDWTVVQRYTPGNIQEVMHAQYKDCRIYDSKAEDAAYWMEDNSMAAKKEQLDEFYQKAEIQILTADSSEKCGKLYRQTLKQMDAMGLSELEEYENSRYQSAKERSGGSLIDAVFY